MEDISNYYNLKYIYCIYIATTKLCSKALLSLSFTNHNYNICACLYTLCICMCLSMYDLYIYVN